MLASGQLSPGALVWAEGMSDWAPAESVPNIQADSLAGRATWSLILGLLSVFGLFVPLMLVAGIAGLGLGIASRRSTTKRGFAVAGILLSVLGLLIVAGLSLWLLDVIRHVGLQAFLGGLSSQ